MRLEHLNLPARDPEGLARWYAETFGMQADRHLVRAPGVLLAFQKGEPLGRAADVHIGFRVTGMAALNEWAKRLGQTPARGAEFVTFRTTDPEGNGIELYCRPDE
jgi:catechol 2,3-dioxygenase-like lactoylglutathione lyase family enzyme